MGDTLLRYERAGTELANERTYLAWLRTVLSCFGLAFHFVDFKGKTDAAAVLIFLLGGGFAICGAMMYYHAYDRRKKVLAVLRSPTPKVDWERVSITPVTVVIGILACATCTLYFVGSIYQGTIGDF